MSTGSTAVADKRFSPGTPRINASPKSTTQETVTLTVPPGHKPPVEVATFSDAHATPADANALDAVACAAAIALAEVRSMLAARAA
ncbi:hypothetical protein KIPE111705_23320 [Kibdelosporangium persicum]